jgi:hypothetical protein
MNRRLFWLGALGIFALFLSLTFASAHHFGSYNYPNNYYNAYSYTSSRSSGYNGWPTYFKEINYNKVNSYGWVDGAWQKTTTYTKITRESPDWRHNYYIQGYRPWYRKYYTYRYPPRYYDYYEYYPQAYYRW